VQPQGGTCSNTLAAQVDPCGGGLQLPASYLPSCWCWGGKAHVWSVYACARCCDGGLCHATSSMHPALSSAWVQPMAL